MLFGYAINCLYGKTMDSLKDPDKLGNLGGHSLISDLLT